MTKDPMSKKILVFIMFVGFIFLASTGILKFRELLRPFNIPYDRLPMRQISTFHDWTGASLVFLTIIYLVFFQKKSLILKFLKNKKIKKIFFIIISLILISVIFGFFLQKSGNIKKLKSIEINQYQGENLSSITDFRENSIKGPQYINLQNYTLNIRGLVNKNLSLNYDQVLNHQKYSKVVTLNCVEGWSVKILWEGVLLKDLLNEAGIKQGSNTVIFYAYDGYSSSLPLDYVLNNNIMLAYKMNGVTLPPDRGFPFQVVAQDKWGYKWVKWITKIEVSDNQNYRGYWEKSGYNQNGNFSGPMFEE